MSIVKTIGEVFKTHAEASWTAPIIGEDISDVHLKAESAASTSRQSAS